MSKPYAKPQQTAHLQPKYSLSREALQPNLNKEKPQDQTMEKPKPTEEENQQILSNRTARPSNKNL